MMKQSLKNEGSSLCYDVIITHQKFKFDKFGDFCAISIMTVRQIYLGMLFPL